MNDKDMVKLAGTLYIATVSFAKLHNTDADNPVLLRAIGMFVSNVMNSTNDPKGAHTLFNEGAAHDSRRLLGEFAEATMEFAKIYSRVIDAQTTERAGAQPE